MSARGAVAAIAWVVLASPSSSFAADFYASDEGSGTADCLTVANACTITGALGKVDDDPGTADVVHLAAGNYDKGSEDRIDVDGPGFSGLVIQGAGRDQTTLNQSTAIALSIVPFQFGGESDNQTVRDLTLVAAATSTAGRTVELRTGSLTLEDVDVHGPPAVVSHRVIGAGIASPNLTVRDVRVFYAPTTSAAASGGYAIAYTSGGGTDEGRLTIEDSSIDVAAGPSRAVGIGASGDADILVRGTVIRMRRTSGAVAQQGDAINYYGDLPPATPSLTVTDSAIAGGLHGIYAYPHPNQENWVASVRVERTSIDAGDIGLSEDGTVPPYIDDLSTGAWVAGQNLDVTVRDIVAAGSISISHDPTATLTLTCANPFLGNPAKSVVAASSGCANTNTSALAAALPDLTEANAWNTAVAPATALATAFRPANGSVLLDTATGTGAPATDLAGNPRLVDAGDADCIAQADRGAYERQDLATPIASCPAPPDPDPTPGPDPDPTPGPGPSPGPSQGPGPGAGTGVTPPLASPSFSALALTPRSPTSRRAARAALSFTLSRAATVAITLRRVEAGRKVGTRCLKPSRSNRRRKRCTRLVKVGRQLAVDAVAGPNRTTLGRLVGKQAIKRGRYRVTFASPGARAATLAIVVRR